jgi:hypothetical protein
MGKGEAMLTATATKRIDLQHFVNRQQLAVMHLNCRGEEGPFFRALLAETRLKIESMPKTYETDGQGEKALAHLHYFNPSSDWYITERDCETEQEQAFGLACLNGDWQNAEVGYINIEELIRHQVELDLYWRPKTIGELRRA